MVAAAPVLQIRSAFVAVIQVLVAQPGVAQARARLRQMRRKMVDRAANVFQMAPVRRELLQAETAERARTVFHPMRVAVVVARALLT